MVSHAAATEHGYAGSPLWHSARSTSSASSDVYSTCRTRSGPLMDRPSAESGGLVQHQPVEAELTNALDELLEVHHKRNRSSGRASDDKLIAQTDGPLSEQS